MCIIDTYTINKVFCKWLKTDRDNIINKVEVSKIYCLLLLQYYINSNDSTIDTVLFGGILQESENLNC